ncbi:hypothetical protein FK521_28345, partial [Klebsiella pneumoniae]|nr:hypothetical protein [Klebsiella pneumoniae]
PHTFLWWAILAGPILGTGAWLFRKATSAARSRARSNWQMPDPGDRALAAAGFFSPEAKHRKPAFYWLRWSPIRKAGGTG